MTVRLRKIVGAEHDRMEADRVSGRLYPDPDYEPMAGKGITVCVAFRLVDDELRLFERLVRPNLRVEWYEVS